MKSHMAQERAEGPKDPSPGQPPGYNSVFSKAPCKGRMGKTGVFNLWVKWPF